MPERPESYGKLLVLLDLLARDGEHLSGEAVREWAALALEDAIEVGERFGLLEGEEAERRRLTATATYRELDEIRDRSR